MIKRKLGKRGRSIRVLIKQGHLLERIQAKLFQACNWTYAAFYMTLIRHPDETAVLYGRNDDEENLLAAALALTSAYQGKIIYLADDSQRTLEFIEVLAPSVAHSRPERIQVCDKTRKSLRELHVRCQLVITSHIIMAAPTASGRRVHVHVSHGLGPKTYRNTRSSETGLASNTTIWNLEHLRAMGKDASTSSILPGYPRQDALTAEIPSREERLASLGIRATMPFVIWAPTVRTASFGAKGRWTEGVALNADEGPSTWQLVPKLRAAARDAGVQLIAKPHPVEADAMRAMGLDVITNDELWRAGISPYQFMGLSDGLISDYSSIWIDYFATNRAIALYCPDLRVFEEGIRGLLDPPFRSLAHGLFIESSADVSAFFDCVIGKQIYNEPAYQRVRKEIGYLETDAERTKLFINAIQRMGASQGVNLAFAASTA